MTNNQQLFVDPKPDRFITKNDFLNYFRYPKAFWFLIDEEIEALLHGDEVIDHLEELKIEDYVSLLREIVESPDSLIKDNAFKLNKLKDKKLIEQFKTRFKIPNLAFYDHSSVRDDRTKQIIQILLDDSKPSAFFYKPSLIAGVLKIKPSAIFKYKGRIYLLEHFWSTRLKRESLATFIFYNHFITTHTNLKIAQYLVSWLSDQVSPNAKSFSIILGNALPFTSQKRKPEGYIDEKMKNINLCFNLTIEYKNSIYERIEEIKEEEYDAMVDEEGWDLSDEHELSKPEKAIEELKQFLINPDRTIDFEQASYDFISQKGKIVPPSSKHYKLIFQKVFPNFSYSSNIIPLDKSVKWISSFGGNANKVDFFLDWVSHMKFLTELPQEQGYMVFPDAVNKFSTIKNAKTKIYYDFESVSLPFSYLANTKPYMQIVLQISLIKTVDNVETDIQNIIIDPYELEINSFKRIIDAIYVDEESVIYIVYNKSFENTRLKEMDALIGEDKYSFKVQHIIDRTVDLANWFTYNNTPHIIHNQLKGFHSIKKVNNMITSKKIEQISKIRKYSDLQKCQNGVMAQSLLLSRTLADNKTLDTVNWEKNKQFMYQYCENDVRSMIAVEMYIQDLLEQNKYPLADVEKYINDKLSFRRTGFRP